MRDGVQIRTPIARAAKKARAIAALIALWPGVALAQDADARADMARAQPVQTAPAAPTPSPPAGPEPPASLKALSPAAAATAASATAAAAEATPPSAAAGEIADIFSQLGDQIYEDCIFELSDEQIEVQAALIQSYIAQGADSAAARKLAAIQIQPPKLSEKCEQMRAMPRPEAPPANWATTTEPVPAEAHAPKKPVVAALPKPGRAAKAEPPTIIALDGIKVPTQWDCAPGVDYVTIKLNGFPRKLTGGEICNPFEDVVREVPPSAASFRLGYTIRTGRLFVVSSDAAVNGQTIAWGLSGRDICRNNPDPDCFATRAVGPLPPGEYAFSSDKAHRVTWGPKTKRHVAAVYLKRLWNKDRFSKTHVAAILKRGNIAIHARLKGEMSEACIGLEPKGWAYVAALIREGRATALNVYIDEPHPQIAEAPPVIVASTFSLTSLFK